jgi:two-component system cell cycle response regulator
MSTAGATDAKSGQSTAQLLLIDDDPLMIGVLSQMLSQYPNQRTATSGMEGLRLARELTPDLILLDVGMPDLDGIVACEVLRATTSLASVPVIFVTGSRMTSTAAAAFKAGGNDYITKPANKALLIQRVREQLERRA